MCQPPWQAAASPNPCATPKPLADAIVYSGTPTTALLDYESVRLRSTRKLVQSGQAFSRSFARRAA